MAISVPAARIDFTGRYRAARGVTATIPVQSCPENWAIGSGDPRSLAAGPRGDLEPHQRPRERGGGTGEVDVPLGATGEALLGALAGALGAGPIDLLRALGRVGEDDHLVVAHLGEPPPHGQGPPVPPLRVG